MHSRSVPNHCPGRWYCLFLLHHNLPQRAWRMFGPKLLPLPLPDLLPRKPAPHPANYPLHHLRYPTLMSLSVPALFLQNLPTVLPSLSGRSSTRFPAPTEPLRRFPSRPSTFVVFSAVAHGLFCGFPSAAAPFSSVLTVLPHHNPAHRCLHIFKLPVYFSRKCLRFQ